LDKLALDGGHVDLVICDLEMPNMDGLEFTEKVRQDPRLEQIPIIAVTSVAGDAAEARGYDAGVDKYLLKLDREEMLKHIHHYLAHGR